jgi:mRNA interferase MazF
MKEGDVILSPIPQANGIIKNRPIVILREIPPYKDFLVCGISSQLNQSVQGFDEIISPEDTDFVSSGLKTKSLLRLGFLAVLPRSCIIGSIGSISPERHKNLLRKLSDYLIQ